MTPEKFKFYLPLKFQKEVAYFEEFAKLQDTKNLNRTLNEAEFWVSFSNSLKLIEGYVLKNEAQIEKGNKKSKSNKAQLRYKEFLNNAVYTD